MTNLAMDWVGNRVPKCPRLGEGSALRRVRCFGNETWEALFTC